MLEVAGSIPVRCFLHFLEFAPRAGNEVGRGGNYTQTARRLAWRGAQPYDNMQGQYSLRASANETSPRTYLNEPKPNKVDTLMRTTIPYTKITKIP